jgi:hypothetical protein
LYHPPSFKGKPRPLETNTKTFPFAAILFSFLKSKFFPQSLLSKASQLSQKADHGSIGRTYRRHQSMGWKLRLSGGAGRYFVCQETQRFLL